MKEELIALAKQAREMAYVPYSNYKVGAALLGKSGRIYTGCNVENVSYGAAICAERTAVVKAVSEGEREFEMLAVIADDVTPASPCGICRQVLYEFGKDLKLILTNMRGDIFETTIAEFLPDGYGPERLGKK